jgi:hypothetical protein
MDTTGICGFFSSGIKRPRYGAEHSSGKECVALFLRSHVHIHNVVLDYDRDNFPFTCIIYFVSACFSFDRLCGVVVRVPGYRPRGPGSIHGAARFSEK